MSRPSSSPSSSGSSTAATTGSVVTSPVVTSPTAGRRPLTLRLNGLVVRGQAWALLRWSALPRWGQALLVFAAVQLITFVALERAARFTAIDAHGVTEERSYLRFVARWDSAWYRRIAQDGYPEVVPRDAQGAVVENPWAFYPLFPLLSRALFGLGIGWPLAGWLVAVGCALGAVVLLRALVDRLAGPSVALWSVALLAAFPTAPTLQFPYTESLGLLLLLGVLLCLQRRRYAIAVPLVLLIGITRPIAVPLVGVIAVHLALRWRRRARVPLRRPDLVALLALLGAGCVAAVAWPLIAWWVTGDSAAYTDSMGAWRGTDQLTPFLPWILAGQAYLGRLGLVLVFAAPIVLVLWLTRRRAAVLGSDLRVWSVCYLAYLYLVLDPTTSLARYFLLLFPLGVLLVASSPSLAFRRTLLGASMALQLVWIVAIWRVGGSPP